LISALAKHASKIVWDIQSGKRIIIVHSHSSRRSDV